MRIRYLDNAATTKLSRRVLEEMLPYLESEYGNASSMYTLGRNAKTAIEKARKQVANLIGVNSNEIYFTSCGSESNNMAIKGYAHAHTHKGKHIITSKIEHPSVLNTCKHLEKEGFEVTYIGVDNEGLLDINELVNKIRKDTILITIMYANNEIGTIQDIKKIGQIAKDKDIVFHTDAVQAVGNIEIDIENIDMLSMSGHKIHAPKGIGAIYIKKDIKLDKFLDGGHQEKNIRSGTENVANIVGIGAASSLAKKNLEKHIKYLTNLRQYCIEKMEKKIKKIELNGSRIKRLPGNVNISIPNIDSEELLYYLDQKGICTSAGSACQTGQEEPSHVLLAIGVSNEMAKGTIRISFSENNSIDDIDYLINAIAHFIPSTAADVMPPA